MPRAKAAKKLRELDSIEHHCSQCNRPKIHKVFEHEDGVLMQCPCGHEFVDVIITKMTDTEIPETEEGIV